MADGRCVRLPGNSSGQIGDIAVESVANLAEDREGQISFTPLDPAEVTPVQPTVLCKPVLTEPERLPFGLNPAPQP